MSEEHSHTPEPWKYESEECGIDEEYDRAEVWITGSDEEQRAILSSCGCCQGLCCNTADIERLIACVNACEGFDPKTVREVLAAYREAKLR